MLTPPLTSQICKTNASTSPDRSLSPPPQEEDILKIHNKIFSFKKYQDEIFEKNTFGLGFNSEPVTLDDMLKRGLNDIIEDKHNPSYSYWPRLQRTFLKAIYLKDIPSEAKAWTESLFHQITEKSPQELRNIVLFIIEMKYYYSPLFSKIYPIFQKIDEEFVKCGHRSDWYTGDKINVEDALKKFLKDKPPELVSLVAALFKPHIQILDKLENIWDLRSKEQDTNLLRKEIEQNHQDQPSKLLLYFSLYLARHAASSLELRAGTIMEEFQCFLEKVFHPLINKEDRSTLSLLFGYSLIHTIIDMGFASLENEYQIANALEIPMRN